MNLKPKTLLAVLPLVILTACGDATTQPIQTKAHELDRPRMNVADFTGAP